MIFIKLLGCLYCNGFIIDKSGVLNMWKENGGQFRLGLNVLGTDM